MDNALHEWERSLVGRSWEVFWADEHKPSSTGGTPGTPAANMEVNTGDSNARADPDDESDENDEPDWYAAQIEAYDAETNKFSVRFEGDEDNIEYKMQLSQSTVRPCARAWVHRSQAILEPRFPNFDSWKAGLPPSTRMLIDETELINISSAATQMGTIGSAHESLSAKRYEHIKYLLFEIRSQIYLRSRLAPISNDETSGDDPTERYIDYLVELLRNEEDACIWYIQCWDLIQRVGSDASSGVPLASPTDLYTKYLGGGRTAVLSLTSLDTSMTGSKRKKLGHQAAPTASGRRTKRRRKTRIDENSFATCDDEDVHELFSEMEVEEMKSSSLLNQAVQALLRGNESWLVQYFGGALFKLATDVVEPVHSWEQECQKLLGGVENVDDKVEPHQLPPSMTENGDSEYVSVEMILRLVQMALDDRILKNFDLDYWLDKLKEKRTVVFDFESAIWNVLSTVYSSVDIAVETDSDPVIVSLRSLASKAGSRSSHLGNVEPFGAASSPLTRQTLDDAMIHRRWYISLNMVLARRERLHLARGVVDSLSTLPSLPSSQNPAHIFDASKVLDAVAPSVKKVSEKYTNDEPLFNKYESQLRAQSPNLDNSSIKAELFNLPEIQVALSELQSARVLSLVEERLLVRRDLLVWAEKAMEILDRGVPSFESIATSHEALMRLLEGKSDSRLAAVQGLSRNLEIDKKVKLFVLEEAEAFLGWTYKALTTAYSAASGWLEKCTSILRNLRCNGNSSVGEGAGRLQNNSPMVEIKRIEELIREYSDIDVNMETRVGELRKVTDAAKMWSDMLVTQFNAENLSAADRLQVLRQFGNNIRPKGVTMLPAKSVLASVESILVWYTQVQEHLCSSEMRTAEFDYLLVSGVEILAIFDRNALRLNLIADDAVAAVRNRVPDGQSVKVLSVKGLDTSALDAEFLQTLLESKTDENEGFPMLCCSYLLWEELVRDFLTRRGDFQSTTLELAKKLKVRMPKIPEGFIKSTFLVDGIRHRLDQAINAAVELENSVQLAVSSCGKFLNTCISGPSSQSIESQLVMMNNLLRQIQTVSSGGQSLVIDRVLRTTVENYCTILGWLSTVVQYPVLLNANSVDGVVKSRISWEVLQHLALKAPVVDELSAGDLGGLVQRIQGLSMSASKWLAEIARLSGTGEEHTIDSNVEAAVSMVEGLSNSRILSEVAMPNEILAKNMLLKTSTFLASLKSFLGVDHSSADRARLPDPDSLTGENDEFFLYRLTQSSPYVDLLSAVGGFLGVVGTIFTSTPGRATIEWIAAAVQWIDQLMTAVHRHPSPFDAQTKKLCILEADAHRLHQLANNLLLRLPAEAQNTLDGFRISISRGESGKSLLVAVKTGGSDFSLGVIALKWFGILVESLGADISRLLDWQNRFQVFHSKLSSFHEKQVQKAPPMGEDVFLRYLEAKDNIEEMQDEARHLIVLPHALLTNTFIGVMKWLFTMTESSSNTKVTKKFLDKKYHNGLKAAIDRHDLLLALFGRGIVASNTVKDDLSSEITSFRQNARIVFFTALQKSLKGIGVASETRDAANLCARLSRDIEFSLYSQYQANIGEFSISKEYKTQARLIKGSLSDRMNHRFISKVLLGKIRPEELSVMSDDDLATPETRMLRDKAQKHATQGIVLTAAKAQQPVQREKDPDRPVPGPKKLEPASIAAKRETVSQPVAREQAEEAVQPEKSITSVLKKAPPVQPGDEGLVPSLPPPPPPSLASLGAPAKAGNQTEYETSRVKSSSGSDRFRLSVRSNTVHASAGFLLEEEKISAIDAVNGYLPTELSETGRTPVTDFGNFLSSKLDSGSWQVYRLRVEILDESREFKKHCRDYEMRKRIAILRINETDKIFLVTPKFHSNARPLTFKHSRSTYAVIVRRLPSSS